MKAAIYSNYGGPEVVELQERQTPKINADQVLVRVMASTVSQVDNIFRGGNNLWARLFTGIRRPKRAILGSELSGEITQVGRDVTGFAIGDRVVVATPDGVGAHAEFVAVNADETILRLPDVMSYEEAAAMCNGGLTALPFLRDHAKLASGQEILIIGAAGSIGTIAVQLAAHTGARVTAVCSNENRQAVLDLGAAEVIDYREQDYTTGDARYDVIFDAVGKSSFRNCRHILRPSGRYLTTVLSVRALWDALYSRVFSSHRAIFAATGLRSNEDKKRDLAQLGNEVAAGELRILVDRHYDLKDIAKAHRFVAKGHKRGNVVIRMPALSDYRVGHALSHL